MFKKISLFLIVALLGVLVVACSSSEEGLPAVLATVNGEEISKEDFEVEYDQYLVNLQQQGHDLEALEEDPEFQEFKPQVQEQILEQLISVELVNQGAKQQGITKDSVENEVDEFINSTIDTDFAGDEEEFENILKEQLGVSLNEYRELVTQELVQEEFLETKIDFDAITVSDEKIQEVYDQQVEMMEAQGMDVPEFEEIKPMIENQLMEEELGLKVQEVIDDLKADSDIDVKVEF
ncbi:SurA N-terminal domain-containing protein [Proteinivorax tanatarense]|uniref:SurA N-terminal domain-containing protein n=1 Tax=Proteinivorax tanatarense TaxID=1260629 RepID=A0AAU7VNN4_9FIRM